MIQRPYVRAQVYAWRTGTEAIPGIGIMRGKQIIAHLTGGEARSMADKLHDLSDRLADEPAPKVTRRASPRPRLTAADGTEEPPLPTSPAESE